jgi:hypothetical protein
VPGRSERLQNKLNSQCTLTHRRNSWDSDPHGCMECKPNFCQTIGWSPNMQTRATPEKSWKQLQHKLRNKAQASPTIL